MLHVRISTLTDFQCPVSLVKFNTLTFYHLEGCYGVCHALGCLRSMISSYEHLHVGNGECRAQGDQEGADQGVHPGAPAVQSRRHWDGHVCLREMQREELYLYAGIQFNAFHYWYVQWRTDPPHECPYVLLHLASRLKLCAVSDFWAWCTFPVTLTHMVVFQCHREPTSTQAIPQRGSFLLWIMRAVPVLYWLCLLAGPKVWLNRAGCVGTIWLVFAWIAWRKKSIFDILYYSFLVVSHIVILMHSR